MLIVSYILPIALSNFIQASWAERYILTLKRRLYMMLRSELSKNWIHYLPIVTNSLNNSPLESLGFLKPSDIRTEADSVKAYLVEHSYSSGPYVIEWALVKLYPKKIE